MTRGIHLYFSIFTKDHFYNVTTAFLSLVYFQISGTSMLEINLERSAVVEWLERPSYGAESRIKVVSSSLGFAMRRLENSLCQPSSKWTPFTNQGRIKQQTEKDRLCFSSAVPNSNPHCPYGYSAI